jgi:hypothetical protein
MLVGNTSFYCENFSKRATALRTWDKKADLQMLKYVSCVEIAAVKSL